MFGFLGHAISVQPPGRRRGLEIEFNYVANDSLSCLHNETLDINA